MKEKLCITEKSNPKKKKGVSEISEMKAKLYTSQTPRLPNDKHLVSQDCEVIYNTPEVIEQKISHSEDTTLAILCGCLYLLAYYL